MVVSFHNRDQGNAHELFQAWRASNPDGFFLNCRSKTNGLLHRSECPHPGSVDWTAEDTGQDLTRTRKTCATSIEALRTWAAANGLSDVTLCRSCEPCDLSTFIERTAAHLEHSNAFDVDSIQDARRWAATSIVRRQGQPSFRAALLRAYCGACAISGCSTVVVLDAAHIIPYRGAETNHVQNGILLRTDLHTLFDLGLVTVATDTMSILVAPALDASEYASLHGQPLRLPSEPMCQPSRLALNRHRERVAWARPGSK